MGKKTIFVDSTQDVKQMEQVLEQNSNTSTHKLVDVDDETLKGVMINGTTDKVSLACK